jgi:hypothetical protein
LVVIAFGVAQYFAVEVSDRRMPPVDPAAGKVEDSDASELPGTYGVRSELMGADAR